MKHFKQFALVFTFACLLLLGAFVAQGNLTPDGTRVTQGEYGTDGTRVTSTQFSTADREY